MTEEILQTLLTHGEAHRELSDGRLLSLQPLLFGRARLMISRQREYADDAW